MEEALTFLAKRKKTDTHLSFSMDSFFPPATCQEAEPPFPLMYMIPKAKSLPDLYPRFINRYFKCIGIDKID